MLLNSFIFAAFLTLCQAKETLLSIPVMIDGVEQQLQMGSDETTDMAALAFAKEHGLVDSSSSAEEQQKHMEIVNQLSSMLSKRLNDVAQEQAPARLLEVEIQLDGQAMKIDLYEKETIDQAVKRFLTIQSIPEGQHATLQPQLASTLQNEFNRKLQEQEAAANLPAPVFVLPLTIANQQFQVMHYENGNPAEEARRFCTENNIAPEYVEAIATQVAQLIQQEINKTQRVPLFQIPLTINEQQFTLTHYQGMEPVQSALLFLRERGVSDEPTIQQYLPQLLAVIQQRLEQKTTPVFSIPLVVGQTEMKLDYFEGEVPEEAARIFAERNGLKDDPGFQQIVNQLSTLIRQQLQARQEQQAPAAEEAKPLFTLPISLKGQVHEYAYYEKQVAVKTARAFCSSKIGEITDSNDQETINAQLEECTTFLAETTVSVLDKLAKEAQEQEKAPKLLFNLEIDIGDNRIATLNFYEGNDPTATAQSFCQQTGISMDNVPAVLQAIQNQIAAL